MGKQEGETSTGTVSAGPGFAWCSARGFESGHGEQGSTRTLFPRAVPFSGSLPDPVPGEPQGAAGFEAGRSGKRS